MPYITFTTTKTLTLNQEKALKESAGQLISILPCLLYTSPSPRDCS